MNEQSPRVALTAELLCKAARELELPMTADQRVTEAAAAELLGYTVSWLRALRDAGTGPRYFNLGIGAGTRLSYRLHDLAAWIERRAGDEPIL